MGNNSSFLWSQKKRQLIRNLFDAQPLFWFDSIGLRLERVYSGQQGQNLWTGKDQLRHHHVGHCGGWPLFIYWQRQILLAFDTWQVFISDSVSMGGGTSVCDWLLVDDVQVLSCSRQLLPCQRAKEKEMAMVNIVQHFSGHRIGLGFWRPVSLPAISVFTQLSVSSVTLTETRSCQFLFSLVV